MKHKFVEYIPSEIDENVLYISIEYDVAKHKCPCGCGDEIVTTLSPSRWKLIYDGETVSLHPSIGNWTHACKSHYFITNDKVVWAGNYTQNQISNVLKSDKIDLQKQLDKTSKPKGFINWIKRCIK
ncbi:MAG: DUF6527 family protein [Mobilitalea sp.]